MVRSTSQKLWVVLVMATHVFSIRMARNVVEDVTIRPQLVKNVITLYQKSPMGGTFTLHLELVTTSQVRSQKLNRVGLV